MTKWAAGLVLAVGAVRWMPRRPQGRQRPVRRQGRRRHSADRERPRREVQDGRPSSRSGRASRCANFCSQKLREPDAQKQIVNQQATYKLLGMLPDTFHLADFFVRVLTEQIIGYYDPKTKVLYVVKDAPEDIVGITIMHELVHALQDQYMNLDSLEHISGDDDRAAAVQAVIEGQATYEQVYIMAGGSGNVAAQLPGGWETMRSTIREAQKTQPVFSSAPMVIQETLLFPYINGSDFIRRYKAPTQGAAADRLLPGVDRAGDARQRLLRQAAGRAEPHHAAADRERRRRERFRRVRIATVHLSAHARIRTSRSARPTAGTATATRWSRPRAAATALAWVTVWDTPADAAEFMSAIDDVMLKRVQRQAAA